MRAAILVDVGRIEVDDVPIPQVDEHDVLVKVDACGICGTDYHIFTGEGNWNLDERGRPIPLDKQGQILGHEITGTVVECGDDVDDLDTGTRVILDQGINCMSAGRKPLCEYCGESSSHLCEHYAEHGITGLPGGFAEYVGIPAVNAIEIKSDLTFEHATLTEPTACIFRALMKLDESNARFTLDAVDPRFQVRTIVIAGGGPAGQIFLQLLRKDRSFDGTIILTDPSSLKREIAEGHGAIAMDIDPEEVQGAIDEHSNGKGAELVIDACGVGAIWNDIPTWIRKQANVLMYGYGRRGASMELLNALQWQEPNLITQAGASGGFDEDGRPTVYRQSLELIENKTIDPSLLITHRYQGLDSVGGFLSDEMSHGDYLKGVLFPSPLSRN